MNLHPPPLLVSSVNWYLIWWAAVVSPGNSRQTFHTPTAQEARYRTTYGAMKFTSTVGVEWKVFLWAGLGTWFCRLQPTWTCRSREQQIKSAGKKRVNRSWEWRCVVNVAVEDRRSGSHAVESAVLRARKMFQDWIGSTARVHVTSWRTVAWHCTGIGIHSILNCCKL